LRDSPYSYCVQKQIIQLDSTHTPASLHKSAGLSICPILTQITPHRSKIRQFSQKNIQFFPKYPQITLVTNFKNSDNPRIDVVVDGVEFTCRGVFDECDENIDLVFGKRQFAPKKFSKQQINLRRNRV
jgi:hypothetical protein